MVPLLVTDDQLDEIVDRYIDAYGGHLRMKWLVCEAADYLGGPDAVEAMTDEQWNDLCGRLARAVGDTTGKVA